MNVSLTLSLGTFEGNLRASLSNKTSCKVFAFFGSSKMAFLVDQLVSLIVGFVEDEAIMLLGVEDDTEKLQQTLTDIRYLLKDAEKRKFDEQSPTKNWLSQLEIVLEDGKKIIEDCRIKAYQLLEKLNFKCVLYTVCFNSPPSSPFYYCIVVAVRHEVGNKIKKLNQRLSMIYERRKQFHLKISEISEAPRITEVDTSQTDPLLDPSVKGKELDAATKKMVDLLIDEKVKEKCRLFALAGIKGIGKTALAQSIFNDQKIKDFFKFTVWVCVSFSYNEINLLKQVIRGVEGKYKDDDTKAELMPILKNSVATCDSLFLVLDDVWRADVWVKLLKVPLQTTNSSVRVLVTTTDKIDVAQAMNPAYIHDVKKLSELEGWDMLRRHLFEDKEEQIANELEHVGLKIVNKCGCIPSEIQAVAAVLGKNNKTVEVWEEILNSRQWSISNVHESSAAALKRNYADLPSDLKQSFLNFSLYREER